MGKNFLTTLIGFILIFVALFGKSLRNKPDNPSPPEPKPEPIPIPQPEPEPSPNPLPEFLMEDWPKVSDTIKEDTLYADILNHAKRPLTNYNRSTNAHESNHGINSDIRNSIVQSSNNLFNCFYIGNGKYYKCKEPGIRKRDVIEYVPNEFRFNRFNLYIVGQTEWDDRPLYILDEYICYINGGRVCIENVLINKNDTNWTDGVSGCLEFSIYAICLCMAIDEKTSYWKDNQDFRSFINYILELAYKTYMQGKDMDEFKWDRQDKLYQQFKDYNGKIKDFMNTYSLGLFWLK